MSLKTQNLPLITLYLLLNLAVFIVLYLTSTFELNTFLHTFENFSKTDGMVFALLPIIVFIILGVSSKDLKEIVVFWKRDNRLPGCYAFSKYAKNDNRISLNLLKNKYGKLPKNPAKQNTLWYGIYRNIKDDGISKTHKDFLLAREWTMITVLFILLAVPSLYFFTDISIGSLLYYFLFLLIEYFVIRYIAKNHAERLVTNTLAYESSRLHQEEYTKKGNNNEYS